MPEASPPTGTPTTEQVRAQGGRDALARLDLPALLTLRGVWDGSVAPGGFVCPICADPWESEPACEHAHAVLAARADAARDALTAAADDAHREARWQTERYMRGERSTEATYAAERARVLETTLRARAAQAGDTEESSPVPGLGVAVDQPAPGADEEAADGDYVSGPGQDLENGSHDVPTATPPRLRNVLPLLDEVRRLTDERDRLAQWKAEALPVLNANQRLAMRVVPNPTLGYQWSEMLAEHVDRQTAALAEVRALAERGTGTDLTPTRMHLSTAQDDLWWCDYLARLDTAWRDRLRVILDRRQGGEA